MSGRELRGSGQPCLTRAAGIHICTQLHSYTAPVKVALVYTVCIGPHVAVTSETFEALRNLWVNWIDASDALNPSLRFT